MFKIENVIEGPTEKQIELQYPNLSPAELAAQKRAVWASDPCIETFNAIRMVINTPPDGGFLFPEIDMVVGLSRKLGMAVADKANEIAVTAQERDYIAKRLMSFRWQIAHERILRLVRRVLDAERYPDHA